MASSVVQIGKPNDTHDILNDMLSRKLGKKPGEVLAEYNMGTIEIFNNVAIGSDTTILFNTKIGPNAIVAAGSVVTKDVPEGVIVGGNPAKVIGYVDDLIDAVDIPVVLGGSLREMAKINDVLNNSNVEFVSMSKPFVAQADFLADWKANGEGVAICQSCNNCYSKKTSTCFKY